MKQSIAAQSACAACAALLLSASAMSHNGGASVAQALRPPADQVLKLKLLGSGVQIYQCTDGAWKFQAPEAKLTDASGRVVGKHYAGPTWEAADGSTVVGEVKAHDDGPDAQSIAWLLLQAKSTAGNGLFSTVRSIQRLQTHGGKAPSKACNDGNANEIARVPYTARYYFFTAKP
jgi:hypothetical protein